MASTDTVAAPVGLLVPARVFVVHHAILAAAEASRRAVSSAGGGGLKPHSVGGIFSGLSLSGLADAVAKALLDGFFRSLLTWVATGAASLVGALAKALSSSTDPVLGLAAFGSEFHLMALLSAAVALPLVALGAIQAIARQDPSGLLRSVLIRLPLALLFTGVSVQIVALGLSATDQASAALIGADGDPARQLLSGLVSALGQPATFGLAAFGGFLLALSAGVVAFALWLELVVRSAAIAAASLFLPLALVGLAWPATSHWARRLGETLAALVLSKLVIAAVLALAAGLLLDSSGLAALVQGVALLAMAAFAPFALLKLVPVIEAGAIAHLEGMGRRSVRAAERFGTEVLGLEGGGVAALAGLAGLASRAGGSQGSGGTPDPGGFHDFRQTYGAGAIPPLGEGAETSASVESAPEPTGGAPAPARDESALRPGDEVLSKTGSYSSPLEEAPSSSPAEQAPLAQPRALPAVPLDEVLAESERSGAAPGPETAQ
jgi:hypothetical protein